MAARTAGPLLALACIYLSYCCSANLFAGFLLFKAARGAATNAVTTRRALSQATDAAAQVRDGSYFRGTVREIVKTTARIDVPLPDGGVATGSLHISHLKEGAYVENLHAELRVGQHVRVRKRYTSTGGGASLRLSCLPPLTTLALDDLDSWTALKLAGVVLNGTVGTGDINGRWHVKVKHPDTGAVARGLLPTSSCTAVLKRGEDVEVQVAAVTEGRHLLFHQVGVEQELAPPPRAEDLADWEELMTTREELRGSVLDTGKFTRVRVKHPRKDIVAVGSLAQNYLGHLAAKDEVVVKLIRIVKDKLRLNFEPVKKRTPKRTIVPRITAEDLPHWIALQEQEVTLEGVVVKKMPRRAGGYAFVRLQHPTTAVLADALLPASKANQKAVAVAPGLRISVKISNITLEDDYRMSVVVA